MERIRARLFSIHSCMENKLTQFKMDHINDNHKPYEECENFTRI
jgi:hypothetical protein